MSSDVNARLWGLGVAVLLLPIIYVFGQYGEESRGFVIFCVTGVFAAIVYAGRRAVSRPRFLLVIGFLYVSQLAVALLVPLPDRIPGAVMIPISFADLFLLLWLSALAEKIIVRRRGP